MLIEKEQIIKQNNQGENEKNIKKDLQLKLQVIKNFIPSGDIINDYNNLMKLTGKNNLYKEVGINAKPQIMLFILDSLKMAREVTLKNLDNTNNKQLFNVDILQAELEATNKLISFYSDKFSDIK